MGGIGFLCSSSRSRGSLMCTLYGCKSGLGYNTSAGTTSINNPNTQSDKSTVAFDMKESYQNNTQVPVAAPATRIQVLNGRFTKHTT